jgi:hypothetical protein
MKRLPWFEIILIIVVMSISVYAALSDGQNLSVRWFVRDDAYYYFKVAQNISEGHGSTFDGINKTNGYHPLWMLICIPIFALARFDLILPLRILLILMSGLSLGTAILLYRLIGKVFVPAIGAIAALYWIFDSHIVSAVYKQGLETGIAAFFVVLLVYKLYEFELSWRMKASMDRQVIELAIIAVLAILSRLDLVFLAGIVGIWVIFRGSLLRYYLPLDIATITVFSLLAFLIRNPLLDYYDYADLAVALAAIALLVKIPAAFLFGLYENAVLSQPVELAKRLFLFSITSSIIVGGLMLGSLQLGILQGSFSRMILIIDLGLTLLVFGINRLMFTALQTQTDATPSPEKSLVFFQQNSRRWLSEGLRYYGIVLGSLGIYMLWNKLAFGTTSPVSGQIKRWWGSLPGRVYGGTVDNTLSFFGISYRGDSNAWNPVSPIIGSWAENFQLWGLIDMWRYFLILVIFATLFYLIFFIHRNKAKTALTQLGVVPLFASAWLQVLYYHAMGYSAYKDWYWITQLVVVVLTLSFILGMLLIPLRKISQLPAAAWVIAGVIGLTLGSSYWKEIRSSMPYNYWSADDPYMEIVPILEANTEPGSIIGLTGGGNPGYFIHDRTVVNMDGLINSYSYFEALQKHEAGAMLYEQGLDYVLANPTILGQQPYKAQFNAYMVPLDIYYGGKQLMRYGAPASGRRNASREAEARFR